MMLCAVVVSAGLLSGCGRAKDPNQVAQDVSRAAHKAAEQTADAERNAENKVGDKLEDTQHVAAAQEQKVEDVEAAGAYRVALAKCEALSGAEQKACRDSADSEYQSAKSEAKTDRVAQDPKR
jgi:outer membrane murein-binding lipoprotein Lpp